MENDSCIAVFTVVNIQETFVFQNCIYMYIYILLAF